MDEDLHLEGAPDDDQTQRLEDFLSELMLIARKYQILLLDPEEDVQFIDLRTHHLIGLGLMFFTPRYRSDTVVAAMAVNSILDGAWPRDGSP
jgi:hypothetical protein